MPAPAVCLGRMSGSRTFRTFGTGTPFPSPFPASVFRKRGRIQRGCQAALNEPSDMRTGYRLIRCGPAVFLFSGLFGGRLPRRVKAVNAENKGTVKTRMLLTVPQTCLPEFRHFWCILGCFSPVPLFFRLFPAANSGVQSSGQCQRECEKRKTGFFTLPFAVISRWYGRF